MARISKKQAMVNTLICDIIVAKDDYLDGRVSLETLGAIYNHCSKFAALHLGDNAWSEFRNYHAVETVKEILTTA